MLLVSGSWFSAFAARVRSARSANAGSPGVSALESFTGALCSNAKAQQSVARSGRAPRHALRRARLLENFSAISDTDTDEYALPSFEAREVCVCSAIKDLNPLRNKRLARGLQTREVGNDPECAYAAQAARQERCVCSAMNPAKRLAVCEA